MALDTTRVFVAVQKEECVIVLDRKTCAPLFMWGSAGDQPGWFKCIHGIAVWRSTVFVSSLSRIQAFRKDGSFTFLQHVSDLVDLGYGQGRLVVQDDTLYSLGSTGVTAFSVTATALSSRFLISGMQPHCLAANVEELYLCMGARADERICVQVYAATDGTPLRCVLLEALVFITKMNLSTGGMLLVLENACLYSTRTDCDTTREPLLVSHVVDVVAHGDHLFGLTTDLNLVRIPTAKKTAKKKDFSR